MKVRLEISGDKPGSHKVITLKTLPRTGELLETDFCGSCEVVRILHTPESEAQDAIITLTRITNR